MEIKETLFTKSFSVESENPYGLAMDFMKKLSDNYKIYERNNKFETDGPVKKSTVIFDVVDPLDKFSQIMVNFSMAGENNVLYVDITGYFVLRVKEEGFFTEVFTEFYLNNIFPVMKKVSEKKMKEINTELEKL